MKKITLLLILTTVLFSCKQDSKISLESVSAGTLDSVKTIQKNKKSIKDNDKSIYTKYEYTDSKGKNIVLQNSLPKGGIRYTDFKGNKYIYAVFWTRIINETDNSIELNIDFPIDSYEIPALPAKYYKTLIPSDTMTIEKRPLFNYGLTNLDPFFDKNINKTSSLKRTIKPNESTGFYVVILRLFGEDQYGVLRTEFSLKGQNLFYKIRDKEIKCGSITIK